MRRGPLEITQNPLDGSPMVGGGVVHVLGYSVDGEGYVGASNGGILEGTNNGSVEMRIVHWITIIFGER